MNFWAERYLARLPSQLQAVAPFTSKDVDFAPMKGGGRSETEEMAEHLDGRAKFLTIEDDHHGSANAGVVTFVDPEGQTRGIDILRTLHGLDLPEVSRLSQDLAVDTTDGAVEFRVMHPVHCLESRAHNTADLPNYSTDHALNQLRVAVAILREYLRELLDLGETRAVLNLNKRVYKFRRNVDAAAKVLSRHQIDVFDAVLVDPRLPEKFHTTEHPKWCRDLGLAP